MKGRKYKIMQKKRSFLEKAIICKKLGPYLETGTTDKVPQIKRLRGIKIHQFYI